MTFARLPLTRQQEMLAFMCARHRWTPERAKTELMAMDEIGLAYVGVEMRLTREREAVYDVTAELYQLR